MCMTDSSEKLMKTQYVNAIFIFIVVFCFHPIYNLLPLFDLVDHFFLEMHLLFNTFSSSYYFYSVSCDDSFCLLSH